MLLRILEYVKLRAQFLAGSRSWEVPIRSRTRTLQTFNESRWLCDQALRARDRTNYRPGPLLALDLASQTQKCHGELSKDHANEHVYVYVHVLE